MENQKYNGYIVYGMTEEWRVKTEAEVAAHVLEYAEKIVMMILY